MSTDLWLEIMSTVEAVAVGIASGVAVWGIRGWRTETVGKRKIELAEETFEKFLAARDWIQFVVRNPYAPAGAGGSRPHAENENPFVRARADALYVAAERLTQKAELFSRLRALRYLMHAYFGEEVDQPFFSLLEVHQEIMIASQTLAGRVARGEVLETIGADGTLQRSELQEQLEKTIWPIYPPEQDKITQKLDRAMDQIKRICQPHLRQ